MRIIGKSVSCLEGERFKNKSGLEYEVIEVLPKSKRKVRFINTGYETIVAVGDIRKRTGARDWLAPYVCGVGVVGTEIENPQKHILYNRWRDMIRRCYDKNSKMYSEYGGRGCYVCEEWKYFPNYVRDIENKRNYINLVKTKGKNKWQVDKDLVKQGNKCYCNELTSIVKTEDNIRERNNRRGNPCKLMAVHRFTIQGEYVCKYNSISEASRLIRRENGLKSSNSTTAIRESIDSVCRKPFGYIWISDKILQCKGIDEISNMIRSENYEL